MGATTGWRGARRLAVIGAAVLALALAGWPGDGARATPRAAAALEHVVSVLPDWPEGARSGAARGDGRGYGRGDGGGAEGSGDQAAGPGRRPLAPEGSGIVIREGGIVATAWHVVAPAERIEVRLADGRVLPARLVAFDAASDVALLGVEADLPPATLAPATDTVPGAPVCAIGNAYGLGLSVTCGVVSATGVGDAGFNAVEDFVQTDAATNPGMSGGALVDAEGRLVGMLSAIFASGGDGNLGVNFAVSAALLDRVAEALIARGRVTYPEPGWRLARPGRAVLAQVAGAEVAALAPDGPAARAGIERGDVVTAIGARRVTTPREAIGALAIQRRGTARVAVTLWRAGEVRVVDLPLARPEDGAAAAAGDAGGGGAGDAAGDGAPGGDGPRAAETSEDCPHPAPVCRVRQAVFPLSGFVPVASATRIGADLLVTNRHNVGDRAGVTLFTPAGPVEARVLASDYEGDLVLLSAEGLPAAGHVLALPETAGTRDPAGAEGAVFRAVGADAARRVVRVFAPGGLILPPAEGAPLGRLHVRARMQPGVSGGALVDADGRLAGIAVGGGDGRFEAIPLADVRALLDGRDAATAAAVQRRLGAAFAACQAAIDAAAGRGGAGAGGDDEPPGSALDRVAERCPASMNQGQWLEAGRLLARARRVEDAIELHRLAVEQTPNSVNARLSLLVSLQLARRFEAMVPHARRVMETAGEDPGALRFAIQAGVWGGDMALAEAGYARLLEADPRQAAAARRFIDNAPPAPRQ